jgi:hypothetical protein
MVYEHWTMMFMKMFKQTNKVQYKLQKLIYQKCIKYIIFIVSSQFIHFNEHN